MRICGLRVPFAAFFLDLACAIGISALRTSGLRLRRRFRVGTLKPSDQIVLVVVTGAHRGEAFEACEFLMDYLKTRAPFWKKEATPEGSRWVDARESDDAAADRWS